MAQTTQPNQFDLTGEGITVNYSTSGIDGKPHLAYKKGRQTLNFSGDEIRTAGTELGTLVTVSIAVTVDRGFTSFSFLLPAFEMRGALKQSFNSVGITTVHKTSIGGPVQGAQQSYKSIPLRGTARQVEFLAQGAAQ
jgi:hypothetical protein